MLGKKLDTIKSAQNKAQPEFSKLVLTHRRFPTLPLLIFSLSSLGEKRRRHFRVFRGFSSPQHKLSLEIYVQSYRKHLWKSAMRIRKIFLFLSFLELLQEDSNSFQKNSNFRIGHSETQNLTFQKEVPCHWTALTARLQTCKVRKDFS